MSDRRGPWYGCENGDCSSEISYPAEGLLEDKEGNVWCEGCLEDEFDIETQETMGLVMFVPEADKEMADLKTRLANAIAIYDMTAGTWPAMAAAQMADALKGESK
jgi:hypothetical protein